MTWELVHGDCRKVPLPNPKHGQKIIVCSDPPYSARTHVGRRTGSSPGGYKRSGNGKSHAGAGGTVSEIEYAPLDKAFVTRMVKRIVSLAPEWVITFGDVTGDGQGTIPWWGAALAKAGLYTFAPLPWCKSDAAPRKSGEGPDCATEWIGVADGVCLQSSMLRRLAQELDTGKMPDNDRILIARHMKRIRRYGSRDGFFFEPTSSTRGNDKRRKFQGEKPLGLMRQVLRQYAEPGDLVVDFFAGRGTTLVAAVEMGCDAWGVEVDEETAAEARQRLTAMDAQPALPGVSFTRPKQTALDLEE